MTLDEYLSRENLTDAAFAARLGRSRVTVGRWRIGARMPSTEDVAEIQAATGGDVTANDLHQTCLLHRQTETDASRETSP